MKLTTEEMELLCKNLLNYVEKWNIKEVSFDAKDDLYFKIWHQDREFTPEFMDNPKYTLGSLDDDIQALRKVLSGQDPTPLDLERLGAVFTALGATLLKKAGL